jgi:hypothetical protein
MFPDEDLLRARQSVVPVSRRRRTILDVPAHVRRIKARPACHVESRRASWRAGLVEIELVNRASGLAVAECHHQGVGSHASSPLTLAGNQSPGVTGCRVTSRALAGARLSGVTRPAPGVLLSGGHVKKRGSLVRPANRTKGGQPFSIRRRFSSEGRANFWNFWKHLTGVCPASELCVTMMGA